MKLEFPKEQSPVVVRQFKNPEELATWYKDKTGSELPEVKPNKQELAKIEANNVVDMFYSMLDSMPKDQVRLNARTNRLEVIQKLEKQDKEEEPMK